MGFFLFLVISQVNVVWMVNMVLGVIEVSWFVFDLYMIIFWICVVIGVLVFGVMFWLMIVYCCFIGQQLVYFYESIMVEIFWMVVLFVILVVMVVFVICILIYIYDIFELELDVQVIGYQWKWQYKYLGQDVEYFSNLVILQDQIYNWQVKDEYYLLEVDELLVLLVGIKVCFLIIFSDVIYFWWVLVFVVKCDVIFGFVNEVWIKVDEFGIYCGQCVELCGKDYGFMLIVVDVKFKVEFDQWLVKCKEEVVKVKELISKEWIKEELVVCGDKVYYIICVVCYQVEGQGMLLMFLVLKGLKIVIGFKEYYLEVVFNGVFGIVMVVFGKQFNEVDLVVVIIYECNVWGNDDGDMVILKDVVVYKQK